MADHVLWPVLNLDRDLILGRDMGDDVADILFDRFRRDAMRFVIRELLGAAAVSFVYRALHAARHPVCVKDHAAIDVARGAANRLDERSF